MTRLAFVVFALAAMLSAASCTDASGTQYLPIGERCNDNSDCGTSPFQCLGSGYPGGYCTEDCKTNGDCPKDSGCVATLCKRKCTVDSNCRALTEEYFCATTPLAEFSYCEARPPATP